MGEAQDFGTCKAVKKNGDPCSQLVNLVRPLTSFLQHHSLRLKSWVTSETWSFRLLQFECQYCQYHVKAQYKKMSSKRAELQSSFSGKAPNKVKGSGSLRERLCQDGFHYGGMSSPACAASL